MCLSNRRSINWVSNILKCNLKPIIEVIETCNENNWQEREIYWIGYYKKVANLCNHHNGGLGCLGRKLTDFEKERIRRIGYKQSYFSEEEKLIIWNKIQDNQTYHEIIVDYPKLSISSFNAIKNGGLWNHITGLSKRVRTNNKGSNNYKSRKIMCSVTGKVYESAILSWLDLYSTQYKYSYFRCMLSGHNKNITTLNYVV